MWVFAKRLGAVLVERVVTSSQETSLDGTRDLCQQSVHC